MESICIAVMVFSPGTEHVLGDLIVDFEVAPLHSPFVMSFTVLSESQLQFILINLVS